jgi:di/tricarboxylate transporter
MPHDQQLLKNAPLIPIIPDEEDDPKIDALLPKVFFDKTREEREEARKDADSEHSRKRDMWVTIAGLILVFVLIILYWITISWLKSNDNTQGFLYLLNSVIMLIIGYIFGTKISH